MCLLVVAIASSVSLTLFSMVRLQTAESKLRRDLTVATSLAEAGKEHAIALLIDNPALRSTVGPIRFADHADRSYQFTISDTGSDISIQTSASAGSARAARSYVITTAQLNTRRASLGL